MGVSPKAGLPFWLASIYIYTVMFVKTWNNQEPLFQYIFLTNERISMVDAPLKSRDQARSNGASTIEIRLLVKKIC